MFEYFPGDSCLHKLDVRTKVVGFISLTLLTFLYPSPVINLVLVLFSFALALASGLSFGSIYRKLKPLMLIFVLIILFAAISTSADRFETDLAQHVFFSISSTLQFTSGGFLYGITLLLRIVVMVVASSVLIFSTPLNDFLQLLEKMCVPYQLAFVLTTAIRFVPTLEQRADAILAAQKARGANIGRGKFFQRIQTYVPVMIPMISVAIRMSDQLAVGMLNRGYGGRLRPTELHEWKLTFLDIFLMLFFITGVVAGVYFRFMGYGAL
jgi:energy-coupling factor transport system permease protein